MSGVACSDASAFNEYLDGPHFFTFAVTRGDPSGDPSLCGDLEFNGRTRTLSATLATKYPDESPYKYWWRGRRSRQTGAMEAVQLRRDVADTGQVVQTGPMSLPLNDAYDALGVVLIITDDGSLQVTDSAFLVPPLNYLPGARINYWLQHWRHIDPPIMDSIRVSGDTARLWWKNTHQERAIDSTMVFADGQHVTTLGPTARSWMVTGSGVGSSTYRLKHFTLPVMVMPGGLAFPNSPVSADTAPDPVPTACASAEYVNTWKTTDQYLRAGCLPLDPAMQYQWYDSAGTELTSWTSDTLFDFPGHTGTGTHVLVLKDSSTTTHATAVDTVTLTVSNLQLVLEGPTFIGDKLKKLYLAKVGGVRHAGQWFERYDDGPRWYPATAYDQDSLPRIWPAGEYTLDLRQHKVANGVLHRGRLFIEVCNDPSCSGGAAPVFAAVADAPADDWGLFGAGPWLSWGTAEGRRTLRLYDLWGAHDRVTAFDSVRWFKGAGGRVADARTGWGLDWTPRDLGLADVRAFAFSVAGTWTGAYVFGMAVDPDLGPAADDVASYDAARGLVVVADGGRAVGFLLRRDGRSALASVQEFGVGRFAPTLGDHAWTAQRAGVQLVGTPRDVQLVLSAGETTGAAEWVFVVLRGATPDDVRERADAVLRALR